MDNLTAARQQKIADFCQRHKVRRLTQLNAPVRVGTDAAFLVEFLIADIPALAKLAEMEEEIASILECNTDLHLYIRGFYLGTVPEAGTIAYDRALCMKFPVPEETIAEFCQRYKITRLARLKYPRRDSVINDADVDFIAEFAPDAKLGLSYFGLGDELTDLLGYPADLRQVDSIEEWQKRGRSTDQSVVLLYEQPY